METNEFENLMQLLADLSGKKLGAISARLKGAGVTNLLSPSRSYAKFSVNSRSAKKHARAGEFEAVVHIIGGSMLFRRGEEAFLIGFEERSEFVCLRFLGTGTQLTQQNVIDFVFAFQKQIGVPVKMIVDPQKLLGNCSKQGIEMPSGNISQHTSPKILAARKQIEIHQPALLTMAAHQLFLENRFANTTKTALVALLRPYLETHNSNCSIELSKMRARYEAVLTLAKQKRKNKRFNKKDVACFDAFRATKPTKATLIC